jgi:hypothetical protein
MSSSGGIDSSQHTGRPQARTFFSSDLLFVEQLPKTTVLAVNAESKTLEKKLR